MNTTLSEECQVFDHLLLTDFVVCVQSGGYIDLEPLKVYKVRHDLSAHALGLVRVVDDSGDDYLYPKSNFRSIGALISS